MRNAMLRLGRLGRVVVLLATGSCAGGASPGGAPAVAARPSRAGDPSAAIFVRSGCTECHGITAFGIKGANDVGPDLTYAYGDVPHRYGMSLEAFLYDPSGVMRIMLASHLRLSAADRDSMVRILKGVYQQRRGDLDSGPPP